MSKKPLNQLYIEQSEVEGNSVEELLRKTIGRKRSGVVRIQYIHGHTTQDRDINAVASIVSYKFYREMVSTEHQVDDRPFVEDLIGTDLPWVGLVKARDLDMDEKYRIEGRVQTLVEQDGFVFVIRDVNDGTPYSDGLSIFTVEKDNGKTINVNTRTGLKQLEVVYLFQNFFEAFGSLKDNLKKIGYSESKESPEKMILSHNGKNVSTIDITLVGKMYKGDNKCSQES